MSTCLPPPNGSFIPVQPGSPAHTFSLFASVAFPIYVAVCVSVFLYFQNSSSLLRHRRTLHVCIGAVACIFALAYTAIFDYVGADRFPCVLLLLLIHLGGLALGTVPLIMKMVLYINQISTLRVGRQVQLSNLKSSTHTLQTENSFRFSHSPHTSSLGVGTAVMQMNSSSSAPYALQPAANWETFSVYVRFVIYPKSRKTASAHERTLNLQFMKSHAYIAMWICMAFITGIITCVVRIATDTNLQNNCTGCVVTKMDAVSNLVMAIWGQLAGPCTVPARLVDRLGILHEFRMCFYSSVFTILGLVLYLIDPFGDGTFNWLNLSLIQFSFCIYFSTVHQVFLSRKSVEGLQKFNAEECYLEVQQDRILKSMLRKHLDEELNSEVYWFLDAVDAFAASPEGKNNIKAKAEVLFREFIQIGAIYEVNLSFQARSSVAKRILAGDIDLHMFDECAYEVKSSLLSDGFLRFLRNLDLEKKKALVAFQE